MAGFRTEIVQGDGADTNGGTTDMVPAVPDRYRYMVRLISIENTTGGGLDGHVSIITAAAGVVLDGHRTFAANTSYQYRGMRVLMPGDILRWTSQSVWGTEPKYHVELAIEKLEDLQ